MNHKFIDRKSDKVLYFSALGKRTFEETSEAQNFRYVGPITSAAQAREEAEAESRANSPMSEEEEMERYNRGLKNSSTRKANTRELSEEDLDKITKNRMLQVKNDGEETEAEKKEREEAEAKADQEGTGSKKPKVKDDAKGK